MKDTLTATHFTRHRWQHGPSHLCVFVYEHFLLFIFWVLESSRMVEAAGLLAEGKVGEGKVGGVGAAQAVRAFVCSLTVDAAPEGEPALAAGDEFHEAVRAAWS